MKTAWPFLCFFLFLGLTGFECLCQNPQISTRIDFSDSNSIRDHQPILIAHRGGVITTEAPECSLAAIRLAAQSRYSMVELDVQESQDGIPVIFHDGTMDEACGIEGKIGDRTVKELTEIYLLKSDSTEKSNQRICTLDQAFTLCEELNLGIMLDLKDEGSESYYKQIADGLVRHHLTRSTVTIATGPKVETYLQDKTLFRIREEDVWKVNYQKPVNVKGKMWFGWPRHITNDMVEEFHKRGAIVIPSINMFHYPKEIHKERAYKDIARMKEAGVDAYQIDSVYDPYFQTY